MIDQIAAATNTPTRFISEVSVEGHYANFKIDGVAYFAKMSRGKVLEQNVRRASY